MVVTRLDMLHRVITILYHGKEGQKLLIDYRISFVIKLLNATDYVYQSLVDKEHSKLFAVDKEKNHIPSLVSICLPK